MYNYHCFNTEHRKACEHCSASGQVGLEEQGDFICPNDGEPLKLLGEINGSAAIKTPTGNRFALAKRKQRNKDHFKKDVLPSITDSDAKRHHFKKLGIRS